MVANTDPIFIKTPKLAGSAAITVAETALAALTNTSTILTAGANGSFVKRLFVSALGTNVASVLRIFANNGSTPATAANNQLLKTLPLPITTLSQTGMTGFDYEIALNMVLPAGMLLIATLGTACAAGWQVTAEYGDY